MQYTIVLPFFVQHTWAKRLNERFMIVHALYCVTTTRLISMMWNARALQDTRDSAVAVLLVARKQSTETSPSQS